VPRILLLLAIIFATWIIIQRIKALPANQRKAAWLKFGTAALVVVVVALILAGKMHWLGAAITGLLVVASRTLPHLVRLFPVLQWFRGQRAAASPGSGESKVESALLRMVLDHASGDLHGEVLAGEFSGRQLDELDREQLQSLLTFCRQSDADSARLLESYLQKRFGESFGNTQAPDSSSGMSRTEALAVLGLAEDADREAIISAHRRLMQKLHPDRGGNDYLAAKLNQAKDLLLG